MNRLTSGDIAKVVNRYIGVSSGYLGNFSYSTHASFYPEYCDLDINPTAYPGTTRERFIEILKAASPADQAKILRGVVDRFRVDEPGAPATRTEDVRLWILATAAKLDGHPVASSDPRSTTETVRRALADAEALLKSGGAVSAVDRVHTAMHGYLRELCQVAGIACADDSTLASCFSKLKQSHPAFQASGARSGEILKILRSVSAVLDAFDPVRNHASLAHPNDELLDPPEAMLVLNIGRSLLAYLDARVQATAAGEPQGAAQLGLVADGLRLPLKP